MNAKGRFLSKVEKSEDGCWLWTASIDKDGYGEFWFDGKTSRAHRASYQLFVGEIPSEEQIDHLCRVRNCVRPSHLEPVTALENVRRSTCADVNRARNLSITNCIRGHELPVVSSGTRKCQECNRIRKAEWRKRVGRH